MITLEQAVKIAEQYTAPKTDTRIVLHSVFYDAKARGVVATDAKRLVFIPCAGGGDSRCIPALPQFSVPYPQWENAVGIGLVSYEKAIIPLAIFKRALELEDGQLVKFDSKILDAKYIKEMVGFFDCFALRWIQLTIPFSRHSPLKFSKGRLCFWVMPTHTRERPVMRIALQKKEDKP